jgi:hypothetical protein
MPDERSEECNVATEWVEWERTSDVEYRHTFSDPSDADDPSKSLADRERGLEEAADDDLMQRSGTRTSCPNACRSKVVVVSETSFPNMEVLYQWTERKQGKDQNGNVVDITVDYTARGLVTVKKTRKRRECAPRKIGNVSYRLEGVEVTVPAELLLPLESDRLFAILRDEGVLHDVVLKHEEAT